MKKVLLRTLTVLLGLFALTGAAMAAEFKVGVVDLQRVIAESAEVKAIKSELENQFSPKRAALMEKQRLIKADIEKYERDSAVMSDSQKQALQEKITTAKKGFEEEGRAYEQALNKAQGEAMEKFFNKVKSTLDVMAKKDHYDLILQKDAAPFATSSLDVTSALLSKLG